MTTTARGGLLLTGALACCLLHQPGEDCRAQAIVAGAGSLDANFFSARGVDPKWDGQPTVRRIGVQPGGEVIVCGTFSQVQGLDRPGLARLLNTGSLDRGFVPAPALLNGFNFVRDFALEPDGRLVVAANTSGLARLDPTGVLDPGFDGQITNGATAVVRLSSGEFLAGVYLDRDPADSSPRYTVSLLDPQGHPSARWSTDFRSATPISFLVLSPDAHRLVVDGLAELSLDSTGANFKSLTNALPAGFRSACGAFQADGRLLLGCRASSATQSYTNATLQHALVRLDLNGAIDPMFSTNVSIGVRGIEGGRDQLRIDALAVQPDGRILIGGFFTRVNGVPRPLLARLTPDGELDPEFTPDIEVYPGSDIDALQVVSAMALAPDNRVVIGGIFSRINGLACDSLARLHTAGETSGGILMFEQPTYSVWETNGPLTVSVLRLGPIEHEVSVCYESLDWLPEIQATGPVRGTLVFAPGETNQTITLAVQDNQDLDGNHSFWLALSHPVGGAVLTGTPETRITLFDDEQVGRPGSVDPDYAPLDLGDGLYSVSLLAIEADGSALLSVYATPDYSSGELSLRRCDPGGLIDPTFHPVVDGFVTAVFPDPVSGKLLVVGNFTAIDGQSRTNLARLNRDGSVDLAFPTIPTAQDTWIGGALQEPDGKLIIYGGFTSFNDVPRRHLVRLLTDGAVDPEFDTSTADWINAVACVARQPDGRLVIAGSFAPDRGALVRLHLDGSPDAAFVPPALGNSWGVRSLLCEPNGGILVGGNFQLPDGRPTQLVRLNADGSLDDSFSPAIPAAYYGDTLLRQDDGKIIVGGKWRFNTDGSRDYSFFTGENRATVDSALLLPDGDLLVSGSFPTFEEWPRPFLARLNGGDAPILGFFEFRETFVGVPENGGPAVLRVRRVGDTNASAVVAYVTIDGSARAGIDYTALAGELIFGPGEVEKPLAVAVLDDTAYRGSRSFELRLRDITAGTRGLTIPTASVDILEDDPGLTFSMTNYWVYGGAISSNGTPWLLETVQRHGDLSTALTVECELTAGTAVPNVDFIPTNVTVRFEPNNYEAIVPLPLRRNDQAAEDRTVVLTLRNPVPDISLATDARAVLTILGPPQPPAFVSGAGTRTASGSLRWLCYLRPGQYVDVEASTNLIDWISVGWVYLAHDVGLSPVVFEDPDAWKYPRRFYRLLQ